MQLEAICSGFDIDFDYQCRWIEETTQTFLSVEVVPELRDIKVIHLYVVRMNPPVFLRNTQVKMIITYYHRYGNFFLAQQN